MNLQRIKYTLLSALFGACAMPSATAQLSNGGFETNSAIPSSIGQFALCSGWNNAGGGSPGPDYYHVLANSVADFPETPYAMLDASDGEGMMGVLVAGKELTNQRNYLSKALDAPLEIGKSYFFGFKVSNGVITPTSNSGIGISDLGVLFSTSVPSQSGTAPVIATPQLKIDTVVYSRDWQTVNFMFTADQAYTHLTIGLFQDDAATDFEIHDGIDPSFAYYFFDEVYLEPVPDDYVPTEQNHDKDDHNDGNSNNSGTHDIAAPDPMFIPNTFTPNQDGDNDIFIPVANTQKEWTLEIYSVWGECVFKTEDETIGWDGKRNGQDCPNGNYVWQVSYVIWNDITGANLVQKKGIVVLLR